MREFVQTMTQDIIGNFEKGKFNIIFKPKSLIASILNVCVNEATS
jgi:hypothetical protein